MTSPEDHFPPEDCAETRYVKRDQQGRYDYNGDWNRLCVCGHSLGVHCAGSPADCLLHSFGDSSEERLEHAGTPDPKCGCEKFRPKRSKGKFVYLQPLTYGPAERRT